MRLLLASKSPRRRQLLAELGYPVEFVSIDVDESLHQVVPAAEVAEFLACRKACAYDAASLDADQVLVTADTVVVCNDKVLGKPADRNEAVRMLRMLSGHTHSVFTGVCLKSNTKSLSFTEQTRVSFNALTDDDISYYVDHYQPYDKAGSYGIQEWIGMAGIGGIQGCFYNVMGLPTARLYQELRKFQK